jgi:hypothetical protein
LGVRTHPPPPFFGILFLLALRLHHGPANVHLENPIPRTNNPEG